MAALASVAMFVATIAACAPAGGPRRGGAARADASERREMAPPIADAGGSPDAGDGRSDPGGDPGASTIVNGRTDEADGGRADAGETGAGPPDESASSSEGDRGRGDEQSDGETDRASASVEEAESATGPRGEVVARASIEGGGEVRLEALDRGWALWLRAGPEQGVSIEPSAWLEGPERATLFFGPRCPSVQAGRERFLGVWTGALARCVTLPAPVGVLERRQPPAECPVGPASAGTWRLLIFRCGHYDEPLATLAVEVSPRSSGGADSTPRGDENSHHGVSDVAAPTVEPSSPSGRER